MEFSNNELSALIEACNVANAHYKDARPPWAQCGYAAHQKLVAQEKRRAFDKRDASGKEMFYDMKKDASLGLKPVLWLDWDDQPERVKGQFRVMAEKASDGKAGEK